MIRDKLLLVLILVILSGCVIDDPITQMNDLKRPIVVVASNQGNIIVRGAEGKLVMIPCDTYAGLALFNLEAGDVIVP